MVWEELEGNKEGADILAQSAAIYPNNGDTYTKKLSIALTV